MVNKKKQHYSIFLSLVVLSTIIIACSQSPKQLPFLGNKSLKKSIVNGKEFTDTVYHSIPNFKFINQDGDTISEKTVKGKIYVADFFFTSCPTICPTMKTQMLKIYKKYLNNSQVMLLSHTIDPSNDSPEVLKNFAENLHVNTQKWQFVTGKKEDIYKIGQKSYMVSAVDDPSQPGGIVHSGGFVLVDTKLRIRGIYDGTEPKKVEQLMLDIDLLLSE
ncbi:MAG: SCO family protein [Pseudarcicella sp.]|nr:SCO family protein [Pseudarcicella sp.]